MSKLIVISLLCVSLTAAAKPKSTESNGADRHRLARIWFERGREHFERLHMYDEAIADFQESYRYDPQPLLLFDIANVARVAHKDDMAIDYFKRYLKDADPIMPEIAEARRWLSILKRSSDPASADVVADEQAPAAPAPAVAPAPAPASSRAVDHGRQARILEITGLGLGVLGLGALGGATGLAVASARTGDQVTAQARDAGMFDHALFDRGHAEQTGAIVLFAVGGAALVSGAVVGIIGLRRAGHHESLAPAGGAGDANTQVFP
jgi:hypothetical protein